MTSSTKLDLSKNQIVAALPAEEARRLLPHLQSVSLRLNEVLSRPGDSIRYIYFPQGSVISLLVSTEDGRTVAVSLVGDEGVVGVRSLLGAKSATYLAVCQVPGAALRIKTGVLQAEFKRGGVLQERLLRYTRYLLAQISQTAACNRIHLLEQRLARWLLMVHSRVKRDEFPITHEFLSHMLGTPRSEVTLAAGALRKSPLICYGRGKMTVLDRQGLEAAACECYKILNEELRRPR